MQGDHSARICVSICDHSISCWENIPLLEWLSLRIRYAARAFVLYCVLRGWHWLPTMMRLVFTGVPPYNDNYKLDPKDDLVLFHDDDGHDVAGTAYRIHVWNKDLTDDVVLSTCNCILPSPDKPCKANLIHIPAYSKIEYSSTYGNYQVRLWAVSCCHCCAGSLQG